MMNNENIYSFLKSKGFRLIKKNKGEFFGNYFNVFANETIELRFSSSKSFETVDIRLGCPNEDWYDLALVKALLNNETNLTNVTNIEEYCMFLQNEFIRISDLFNGKNYLVAKEKLEYLRNERVKQMFPGMTGQQ